MTIPSKYETFLTCLQAAAVVADQQNQCTHAATALATVAPSTAHTLPSTIDGQAASVADLVEDYVNYMWHGDPKPSWLEQAGL